MDDSSTQRVTFGYAYFDRTGEDHSADRTFVRSRMRFVRKVVRDGRGSVHMLLTDGTAVSVWALPPTMWKTP